jgi:uncharacterized membrane protein
MEASIEIERSVADVFAFYRDFTNLPRFLGDVIEIQPAGDSTYRWTIEGPRGARLHWSARITEERPDALIRYETIAMRGLKSRWEIAFEPGIRAGTTIVRERLSVPLGLFGRGLLALVGKSPANEVSANLRRMKQLLETGRVTDTSYAVPGKFPTHGP